jgi:hypothetical protein
MIDSLICRCRWSVQLYKYNTNNHRNVYCNLKGQCHEIFDLRFFLSSNYPPFGPWFMGQSRFKYGFECSEVFEVIIENHRLPRSQCDLGSGFNCLIETAEADSAVSMIPRMRIPWFQWDRGRLIKTSTSNPPPLPRKVILSIKLFWTIRHLRCQLWPRKQTFLLEFNICVF